MDASENGDGHNKSSSNNKTGGWITFVFIIVTMAGTTIAAGGWISNLVVFLIQEFNVKPMTAAKIFNVVNGCTLMLPIAGAIIADSFFGCFAVIWVSTLMSLLGCVCLVLTSAVKSLKPSEGQSPTNHQYAVLYIGLALVSIGLGGTRYTIGPLGASQFDKPKHVDIFFNWYIFTIYFATVISSTAIVYIEDSVSWALGFGICVACNALGLAIFLAGKGFYRRPKPQRSPFVDLGRVIFAAAQKRKLLLTHNSDDYYQGQHEVDKKPTALPTNFLGFLNHAALKTKAEETNPNAPIRKSGEICTVQDVEDLKSLIKLVPLWSTGLFLIIPLVFQLSLATLQALTMERRFGAHIKFPAGSLQLFIIMGTASTLIVVDRLLFPMWAKHMSRWPITPLRRVAIGHFINIISLLVTALVEMKRLKAVRDHNLQEESNAVVPVSVFWLVPPLALAGIAEAFFFPGNVTFFYQQFPATLKSTSTAAVAMYMGVAFYLGIALMDFFRRTTDWLPDNINQGRLDYLFWVGVAMGTLNYVYFLACAYMYRSAKKVADENEHVIACE